MRGRPLRSGQGHSEADRELRALHDEHAGALLSYVTALTGGDRHRAEDVVQETMLRAWQHLAALQVAGRPVRPWLFTVARHLVVDGHRARSARPAEVGGPPPADLAAPDELDRALHSWLVAEALATLSPAHRAVLVELYFRGRTVAEAAAALGVPAGTVKSRAFYALRGLRLALDERGVTP